MANQWFKFYGAEYLSDPKMDRLTVQERSCWLTLLCMASQTGGIIKYISIEGLLMKSGVRFDPYDTTEWDDCQNVLKTFEQYEMIDVTKDGSVQIKNWEKRQEHNLSVAERVAKSRAKKRNVTIDVTNVTSEENRIEENREDIIYTDEFLKFYELYPRKIGKLGAFRKWETTIKKTPIETIMAGLQNQVDAKMFDKEQKFIKHPEVWLNKGCWDDEIIKKEEQVKKTKSY